jgi:hypothetical protein
MARHVRDAKIGTSGIYAELLDVLLGKVSDAKAAACAKVGLAAARRRRQELNLPPAPSNWRKL